MSLAEEKRQTCVSFEENLKKAVAEFLILRVLADRSCYIGEIAETIRTKSGESLNIIFPYSAIYRLESFGFIEEQPKQIAPDGRRRQYFSITDSGRARYEQQLVAYRNFVNGIEKILA
jgi:PadR family transcriptional regulator PadR